jgi:hypothetical protein
MTFCVRRDPKGAISALHGFLFFQELWVVHNDWFRLFAISSPSHTLAVLNSVLWMGLQKSK